MVTISINWLLLYVYDVILEVGSKHIRHCSW
jgi:hypothetical protein